MQTDELIFEEKLDKSVAISELFDILDSCSARQVGIITDIVKATKISFDKYERD